ncbi:hypothetical protein CHLRE_16g670500v5 [Chlamydomonas reinhardtii]|uniref:Lon N-terminal domain-containing protein n=1 Tax=Chlamydomonas reinhardtii TaxID=3055 RepID=A0A2K3CU97_CHLRE|nr:uncharacterized protein CHLRE_16g670500v5 [Chlamydomonas reinhardtii]PNW71850.1 hypothetical protein CHLRE_16g670500v5 [Chlamydomonas reinhardtii]
MQSLQGARASQCHFAHSRCLSRASRVIGAHRATCRAAAAPAAPASAAQPHQAVPHELPLFPVQPIGVFLPGMTKTLHLYEPHFIAMVEEAMASPHKLMATAVLEPYMGGQQQPGSSSSPDSSEAGGSSGSSGSSGDSSSSVEAEAERAASRGEDAAGGPGSFVGGYNFSLSCGCLVQVLSAKPYTGGYLVRIRGEGRLGISGLPQTGPYMRAQVYPLPDQPLAAGEEGRQALQRQAEHLQDIMRDVQNLSSKFRCDETAALQQAMRWLHGSPLTPGISAGPAGLAGDGAAAEGAGALMGEATAAGAGGEEMEGEEEEEVFDPELAVRLSWAALQWLPFSTTEERMRIVRSRLLAMDTRDVAARLGLAAEAMAEARAALAARVALKEAAAFGQ